MSYIMQSISEIHKDLQKGLSPEVDEWILMGSPITMIMIIIAYLAFVLKIGPTIMKNRPAMELRKVMIFYNGVQVLFSVFLVWMGLRIGFPLKSLFSTSCSQGIPQSLQNRALFTNGAWWYHLAKITELLDTIFFVLRKKNRQITFLHVYHHSMIMFFSWVFPKYVPGENGTIVGLINSMVHVIMYAYYMIAAMGPAYQKYIWWKKYITVIQLVQFVLIFGYMCLLSVSNCGHSKIVTHFSILSSVMFFYLFLDFYRKSYIKSKKPIGTASATNSSTLKKSVSLVDRATFSTISKDAEILAQAEKMRKCE